MDRTLALGLGTGVFVCWSIGILAGIFLFVLWILMLIDCIKRDDINFPNQGENAKLIWLLVIIFAGSIGAVIYYFLVKRKA